MLVDHSNPVCRVGVDPGQEGGALFGFDAIYQRMGSQVSGGIVEVDQSAIFLGKHTE